MVKYYDRFYSVNFESSIRFSTSYTVFPKYYAKASKVTMLSNVEIAKTLKTLMYLVFYRAQCTT